MSIDRIGKREGAQGISPSPDAVPSAPTGGTFKVERPTSVRATAALDRVRSGEMTVEQYLDLKVEAATAHLAGPATPEQLSFIKNSLREQLAADPVLVDLVRAATGSMPTPRE
jgi:hypothetical protein